MSILRWSGSKAKLIPDLLRLKPQAYDRYIEPFAGSAQLFFALRPTKAALGDLNNHVMSVYEAIAVDPHAVADALDTIPKNSDAYYKIRALNPEALTLAQQAARMIFLMKSCFNGVYRTNRSGTFNVPMGNRIYAIPSREALVDAQSIIKNALLFSGSFEKTIASSRAGDWIYMDPPYRQDGRYRGEYGYSAEFTSNSLSGLVGLARDLASAGRFVTISYCDDDNLTAELHDWTVHKIDTLRTVASASGARRKATELILTSYPS